ncbi:PD-(D/E)XK nuclease family protein [Leptolyngbya sp. FACHB-16]|uniref:PD-(D/E)XK nuclease family protein n=1 Tax=unclassified Leptolyngbya TaxID=2650499 RepID=UPI001A7E6BF0|nr:PD-(D/E)XK nuclease family protein [Leptolyngbya sp. FACHB-16]
MAGQRQLDVITPTRATARALEVSPKSLQELARELLKEKRIQIVSPLKAQKALREAIRQVVPVRDLDGTVRTWMSAVQALLRASSSLPTGLAGFSERATQLLQVTQAYQAILHQEQLVDACEVLWRAIEQQPERRSFLIYGYFQPRADELALIEAIAGENSIFCLPVTDHNLFSAQQATLTQLQGWGWQMDGEPARAIATPGSWLAQQFLSPTSEPPPEHLSITAHAYPNQDAEARGVLAQVKHLLNTGVPAREIAVIARDEAAYGPLLLDIAWEYGIPLRALYSIPLSASRVGAWLTLLLDVIEQKFPFELTARLLSHPLSISAGADFWATVRQQRPTRFEGWQAAVQELIGLDLSPLKMPTSARRDTWVDKLTTIFKTFKLRRRAARWARESLAFSSLETGLVELSQPEQEILSWQDFANELRASLAILGTPAQPGRGGVELHTPVSIIGTQYRYLFVIDAVEGRLPALVQDDRVLDFYERKQLQMQGIKLPSAAETARREAFEFYALLHTVTEQFTLSYSVLNGEPSAYLKQLGLKAKPVEEQAIASPEEARRIYLRQSELCEKDAVLEGAIASFQIEQHRESAAPQNEYDGIVGIPFDYSEYWFSASQLTQLGQCPFKWFLSRVLKLAELEEVDEDVTPVSRGNLYHKVLELALKAYQADSTLDITDEQRLHDWFVDAESQLNFPVLPAWESRRKEHIRVLRRAMQQPDFRLPEAEVLQLEDRFEGEWHGFKIRGYVDRIDRTDQGLVLMDYKTRSSPPAGVKDATGKAKIDLQLPLYEAVAAPFFYPDTAVHRTSYYSLTAGKDISPKTSTNDQLQEVADRLKTHLTTGHYPVEPDVDRKACAYCAYDSVCRQGERLNRKGEDQ